MDRLSVRITYDQDADAAYVYFEDRIADGSVEQTVPSGIDLDRALIAFDFNVDGKLVGIEILGASRILTREALAVADSASGNT